MQDELGAFLADAPVHMDGAEEGPLAGRTFAAKDIYDVAGTVTGCGNPTWRETHGPAAANAPAVQALLDAGAALVGKTITDELAYSLFGENAHYGTPQNVNAPGRIPGGSSAGSAAAVAGELVDLALGSDTGGSVRAPASFCGIYGLRPSHGRIALDSIMPLAPSFDTVGWFARDPALLRDVGEVLLDAKTPQEPGDLILGTDAFALGGDAAREALEAALKQVRSLLGKPRDVTVASLEGQGELVDWMTVFRTLQAGEIWHSHGAWVSDHDPDFGPGVKERFEMAAGIGGDEISAARTAREAIAAHMAELLADNAVLVVPSAPDIAPKRGIAGEAADAFRTRALSILCIAGLARLPQISLPLATVEDEDGNACPVGLSLVAAHGNDEMLLKIAADLAV